MRHDDRTIPANRPHQGTRMQAGHLACRRVQTGRQVAALCIFLVTVQLTIFCFAIGKSVQTPTRRAAAGGRLLTAIW